MFSVRSLSLRVRYTVAFVVAAIIFAVIVIWVDDHQNQSYGQAANPNASQAAQEQQETEVVVEQEQAPRAFRFRTGTAPVKAAGAAVDRYMTAQVSSARVNGPLDGGASCTAAGGTPDRPRFRCEIHTGPPKARLMWPFAAVVHPAAARVTYCEQVTPPYPLKAIPLQAACR